MLSAALALLVELGDGGGPVHRQVHLPGWVAPMSDQIVNDATESAGDVHWMLVAAGTSIQYRVDVDVDVIVECGMDAGEDVRESGAEPGAERLKPHPWHTPDSVSDMSAIATL